VEILASRKTKTSEAAEEPAKTESQFTGEQIAASARYSNRRDLVNALLDKDKKYTITQVDQMVNLYEKGKVK
jgi:hypothetical protein